MNIYKISDFESYTKYKIEFEGKIQELRKINTNLNLKIKENNSFHLDGFSWTAQSNSKFLVDTLYSNSNEINLRESLVCTKTELNNRLRGCIHIFESLFNPQLDDDIYLTEQSSLLAIWMAKKYTKLSGSEYLKNCTWYYRVRLFLRTFPKIISHQDLTKLSFKKERFDYILSFDCFEHIPNYKKALSEIYRVLKIDGKLLFSVPFDLNNENTLIRAILKNDEIQHLVEPEYHADPISEDGCLSFYTFGWQLLTELRKVGFKKVSIILYWSKKYCYLGDTQILISAEK